MLSVDGDDFGTMLTESPCQRHSEAAQTDYGDSLRRPGIHLITV
jgi:hypothetical protein